MSEKVIGSKIKILLNSGGSVTGILEGINEEGKSIVVADCFDGAKKTLEGRDIADLFVLDEISNPEEELKDERSQLETMNPAMQLLKVSSDGKEIEGTKPHAKQPRNEGGYKHGHSKNSTASAKGKTISTASSSTPPKEDFDIQKNNELFERIKAKMKTENQSQTTASEPEIPPPQGIDATEQGNEAKQDKDSSTPEVNNDNNESESKPPSGGQLRSSAYKQVDFFDSLSSTSMPPPQDAKVLTFKERLKAEQETFGDMAVQHRKCRPGPAGNRQRSVQQRKEGTSSSKGSAWDSSRWRVGRGGGEGRGRSEGHERASEGASDAK